MSFEIKATMNMTEVKELEKLLVNEVDKTIYDIADQIFAISQQKVPVNKATLKKSGNIIFGRGYAYIGYNTPYAEIVHDGTTNSYSRHKLGDTYNVPGYQRSKRGTGRYTKGKNKKFIKFSGVLIDVKSHDRTFGKRTGLPYLDDAITEVLKKLPEEIRNMISIRRVERDY